MDDPGSRNKRIFLSYGHDAISEEITARLRVDLEARGFDIWVDRHHIKGGDDWRREISEGLKTSSHVLALLSKHSTRKPGVCRQEIALALGPAKAHVYTVLVEPEPEVTPPLLISHIQWLDLHEWPKRLEDPTAFENWYADKLSEVISVLERNQPFAGEIAELEKWLKPVNCTSDMVEAESGFVGRQWLLGDIAVDSHELLGEEAANPGGVLEMWRTGRAGGRVLWLRGGPGSGKSAVAARLAHIGRARVIAVHFCRHDRPERRDAATVIRTISYQMATRLGDYRSVLLELARKGVELESKNAFETFDTLMANPLRYELGGGRGAHDRHIIVLDALDETLDNDGRSDLLSLVASEFAKLPDWIGLLITSRPEAAMVRHLGQYGVQKIDAGDARNVEDVRAYATAWLAQLFTNPTERQDAIDSVVSASAGNFLYIRHLRDSVSNGTIEAAELSNVAALPPGLGSLYLRWFETRFADYKYYQSSQRPFLELMLAAREPLPLCLAADLLRWDEYNEQKIVEPLGSLCPVEERSITFFHKSLSDWIADPDQAGPWRVSRLRGDKALAAAITAFLSRQDGPQPTKHTELSSEEVIYILKWGVNHAVGSGAVDRASDLLKNSTLYEQRTKWLGESEVLSVLMQDLKSLYASAAHVVPGILGNTSVLTFLAKYRRRLHDLGIYPQLQDLGMDEVLKKVTVTRLSVALLELYYLYITERFTSAVERGGQILEQFRDELSHKPLLTSQVYDVCGMADRKLGAFDAAERRFILSRDLALDAKDSHQASMGYMNIAKLRYHNLAFAAAHSLNKKGVETLRRALDEAHDQRNRRGLLLFLAEYYRLSALPLMWEGDVLQAEAMHNLAGEIYSDTSERDRYYICWIYDSALLCTMRGNTTEADVLLGKCRAMTRSSYDRARVAYYFALNELARYGSQPSSTDILDRALSSANDAANTTEKINTAVENIEARLVVDYITALRADPKRLPMIDTNVFSEGRKFSDWSSHITTVLHSLSSSGEWK